MGIRTIGVTGHATPKPLYAQVRDLMLAGVRSGEWATGEPLPNEFSLAARFDVSIGTIRRAAGELETIGVLVRKQGRGTFVAGPSATALRDRFTRLRDSSGVKLQPAYTLQAITRRQATPTEKQLLGTAALHGVIDIVQHLAHGGRTIGMECSTLPGAMFPKLESQLLYGQHLYDVLAGYGCLVTRIEETTGAEMADPAVAALLGTEPGATLLSVTRTAFDLDDRAVEWRAARYFADAVRYAGGPG
jgi:GntR family transcriptional regulator